VRLSLKNIEKCDANHIIRKIDRNSTGNGRNFRTVSNFFISNAGNRQGDSRRQSPLAGAAKAAAARQQCLKRRVKRFSSRRRRDEKRFSNCTLPELANSVIHACGAGHAAAGSPAYFCGNAACKALP
jgi:hypothetical protein